MSWLEYIKTPWPDFKALVAGRVAEGNRHKAARQKAKEEAKRK